MFQDNNSRESGVSETIGFIIILGIVMTGIAMVALYGYPALVQEQANANIKNMQKNMLVLQSDLRSLTAKGVPYQETTIQVSGGTLTINQTPDPLWPVFTINGIPGFSPITHYPGELKFTSDDGAANIALENGAVHIRYWSDMSGSAMLTTPGWFYDTTTKTYVIHLIQLDASQSLGTSGIGTVRMQLVEPATTTPYDITDGNVTISYQANPAEDYMVAWKNYFENPDLQMRDPYQDQRNITYRLDPAAKSLVVKKYNITILSI